MRQPNNAEPQEFDIRVAAKHSAWFHLIGALTSNNDYHVGNDDLREFAGLREYGGGRKCSSQTQQDGVGGKYDTYERLKNTLTSGE